VVYPVAQNSRRYAQPISEKGAQHWYGAEQAADFSEVAELA